MNIQDVFTEYSDEYDKLWECTRGGDIFENIEEETIYNQDRWHTYKECTVKHKDTGKFYNVSWKVGSTEYQECDLDLSFTEVEPVEVTTTVYKVKKDPNA